MATQTALSALQYAVEDAQHTALTICTAVGWYSATDKLLKDFDHAKVLLTTELARGQPEIGKDKRIREETFIAYAEELEEVARQFRRLAAERKEKARTCEDVKAQ